MTALGVEYSLGFPVIETIFLVPSDDLRRTHFSPKAVSTGLLHRGDQGGGCCW